MDLYAALDLPHDAPPPPTTVSWSVTNSLLPPIQPKYVFVEPNG